MKTQLPMTINPMAKGAWTGFSVTAILMVQLFRNVPGEASGVTV